MRVILSCTTTYERSEIFYYCLQSLLRQTVEPDLFLVNISEESYLNDSGFSEVPQWLRDERIKINWVENTGSYRKLLPAIDYAKEGDLIITADDDIIYGKTWLKQLKEISQENPDDIVCIRARKIEKNVFNTWKNYGKWHLITKPTRGKLILPTGGAGAVYKKELLNINFLTDLSFLDIAPTTDDLWFRMASLLKGTKVKVYPKFQLNNMFIEHDQGLININDNKFSDNKLLLKALKIVWYNIIDSLGIGRNDNDFSWRNIVRYATKKYSLK